MNVSLDSLKRVLKISQKDALKNTLEGIEESLKVGLKLKLALSLRIAMIFADLAIVSVWLLMVRFAHAYTIKTP